MASLRSKLCAAHGFLLTSRLCVNSFSSASGPVRTCGECEAGHGSPHDVQILLEEDVEDGVGEDLDLRAVRSTGYD